MPTGLEGTDRAALLPLEQHSSDHGSSGRSCSSSPSPRDSENTSSMAGAYFNYVNTLVGAGAIGIPLALSKAGLTAGLLSLGLVAVCSDYTAVLLIKCGILTGKYSYQEMVKVALGTPGYVYISVIQFLVPFIGMCSYTVIAGDTLARILAQLFLFAEYDNFSLSVATYCVKVAAVLLVTLPLSLLKNISRLEKVSALSLLCIGVVFCIAVYEGVLNFCAVRCFSPECCESSISLWVISPGILESIGIIAFAFACHQTTFLIYTSLHNCTLTRYALLTHTTMSSTFAFYACLGLAGFIPFMGEVQGDLLNNYCIDDIPANVARFTYVATVLLTYPIQSIVCREVAEIALSRTPRRVLSKIPSSALRNGVEDFLYAPSGKSLLRRIVLTFIIVISSLGIALSTNDLGMIQAFGGNFADLPLILILPTACFLKLAQSRWYSREKLTALSVMMFGVSLAIAGTVQSVVQAVKSYSQAEREYIPNYCQDLSVSDTCWQLLRSTDNFTLTAPLCDCAHFYGDNSSIEQCNTSTTQYV